MPSPNEPLLPYQYDMIFALIQHKLTAYELSYEWPFRKWFSEGASYSGPQARTRSMQNRLRPLIARGWVEKLPDDPASGIYTATERARAAVSW